MAGSRSETLEGVKDQATSFMQSVIEQAAAQALGLNKSAAGAQKKAKRGFHSASETVTDTVPSTRDVAFSAASAALEIWQSVKGKAGETLHVAEDQVADRASELLDYTAAKAKDVGGTIAAGAHVAAETGKHAAAVTASGGKQAALATASGGKQAAVATADTGASLVRTAFWLSAAGSIVYFVFLDEDRQKEVRKVLNDVVGQARDLAGDLRGQDGEFA